MGVSDGLDSRLPWVALRSFCLQLLRFGQEKIACRRAMLGRSQVRLFELLQIICSSLGLLICRIG